MSENSFGAFKVKHFDSYHGACASTIAWIVIGFRKVCSVLIAVIQHLHDRLEIVVDSISCRFLWRNHMKIDIFGEITKTGREIQ